MFSKKLILLFIFLFLFQFSLTIFSAPLVEAQVKDLGKEVKNLLETTAEKEGAGFAPYLAPVIFFGRIIRLVLTFVGVVFIIVLIYAGYLLLTAAGNEDQIKRAKSMLWTSVIGLIIIVAAYVISNFVITKIYEATLNGGEGGTRIQP